MEDRFVQAIRYKLQKRVRRLNSADIHQFPILLRLFFQFLDITPLLAGVRDELMARVVKDDVPGTVDRIINGEGCFGASEPEAAAMGYLLLKKLAEDPEKVSVFNIGMNLGGGTNET